MRGLLAGLALIGSLSGLEYIVQEPVRTRVEQTRKYTKEELVFPEGFTVEYYRVKSNDPRPVVIISPMLGGTEYHLEHNFMRHFADNGFDAVLLRRSDMHSVIANGPEKIVEEFKESSERYHRVVDMLVNDPLVDDQKLCSLGISMGALKNTVQPDPRIRYGVLIFPGAIDMLLESPGVHEFIPELKKFSSYDFPLEQKVGTDPQRTLFIIAKQDEIIPLEAAEELRKRAGYPETIYLTGGHISSLIYAYPYPYIQKRVVSFFKNRIAADETHHKSYK